ncbi:uncharacterized protein J4E78_000205 [Alternaria triticimaculans]|uniref:uncharacterized protein n=1 Tax=Alternaria triticimaculans TaxID=297637 RepID=UPI0020C54CF3|nr:uncharacterized protein J4E78_000205 [Alternaria triticimaculans]KAI4671709.1 hypothetical protein J4E78_000205 [Alternaria triticimaculans]
MCRHILNAQVSIRSPCCKKWFDCAECHQEQSDHPLQQTFDMVFICKKCKKAFRKDAREFEDAMLKDERVRAEEMRTIFDVKEAPDKLG